MTYTERKPTVFDHVTTEAVKGDYFRLPYTPTMKVMSCVDLGDYVAYVVQKEGGQPEHWDVRKTESEQRDQERSRIEADEAEMGEIIYDTALEELEQSLGFSLRSCKYDWLTEPIGSNPDYIFGMTGEQMAEALPPVENGYHNLSWTSDDCEI